MSLDALFGFAAWLYVLWPFTMAKRLRQYWCWYASRPDRKISLPSGEAIPVYEYPEPSAEQVKQINQRVFVPLGIWLVAGLGLLLFHNVPEGRWVVLILAHLTAFCAIWVIYWKDTVLTMSSTLASPHRKRYPLP